MMEVKGIGQKIPKPPPAPAGRFETIFDESKRKLDEAQPADPATLKVQGQTMQTGPIDLMRAGYLATNPLFVSLQEWMEEFYRELRARATGTEELRDEDVPPDYHLRLILYDSLKKLLREIICTKDHVLQSSYLQRVHTWFAKREASVRRTNQKKELGVLSESEIPPPKKYLMEVTGQKLYQQNMRTLHPEIPPPQERLADYTRRAISSENKTRPPAAPAPNVALAVTVPPLVPEPEKEKPPEAASILPSPPLIPQKPSAEPADSTNLVEIEANSNFLYYHPKESEEQKVERMWFGRKNKALADKRIAEELVDTVNAWGQAKGRVNENIVRKFENINYGNNFPVRNHSATRPRPHTTVPGKRADVDYQRMYEEASDSEEEPAENSSPTLRPMASERKETKLPAIVDLRPAAAKAEAEALVLEQAKAKAAAEAAARARPATAKPKKGKKKKGSSPTRAKSPAGRGKKQPPSRPKAPEKVRSVTILPKTATVIAESDKMRVDYIRRMYGNLIGETKDGMEVAAGNIFHSGPKGTNTLSLYNKDVQRPYTVQEPNRPARTLPITHQGSREQFRVDQAKEINRIKEHLAKEDVPCSMVALQRAVLIPEDFPAYRMTADNFLKPGARLLVNPYAKKRKKKKKGKKGKKSKK